jgi:hypothetical protein
MKYINKFSGEIAKKINASQFVTEDGNIFQAPQGNAWREAKLEAFTVKFDLLYKSATDYQVTTLGAVAKSLEHQGYKRKKCMEIIKLWV